MTQHKQREIKYDLCQFGNDPAPIINTDGTQFFTDEELELIENFNNAKNDLVKAKTEKKKAEARTFIEENTAAVRALYAKAVAYLKDNAIDLVKECTYQPWDEATTARVQNWIDIVDTMHDPATVSNAPSTETTAVEPVESDPMTEFMDDMPEF